VDGRVGVRFRASVRGHTTLDNARLIAIDHAEGVEVLAVGDRVVDGSRKPAYRVTTSAGVDIPARTLSLLGAHHSRLGDALAALGQFGGGASTLAPGDTLTLEFASPSVPSGPVREWYLLTERVNPSAAPGTRSPRERR